VRPFRYERAADAAAAVELLGAEPGAAFLAGGTNLVDLMKLDVERPELLIDVTQASSDAIQPLPGGGIRIGAAVRNSDLAADPAIRKHYPALSQALLSGATYQLRNLATTGGNLMQRTRCVYFQDVTKPCNKRVPGAGCAAREGYHRGLAVLGHSPSCVATNPSDMAVALAAFDAVVRVQGAAGVREVPLTGFHRLPGDEPQRETVLERGELIVAVDLPALPIAARSQYRKVRDRASYAFALVSVAAAIDVHDGVVRDVRIALGGVAHKPWRATRAEAALRGAEPTAQSFGRAADAELQHAQPLASNAFKVPLARNTIVRTLLDLVEQP
jgi:xanthine dehydrogenase YagS FAD-binding subunit